MRITGAVLLVTLLGPLGARAFTPQYRPHLETAHTSGRITIDGRLDDPGWAAAGHADGFAERSPGDAIAPLVDTEAWLTYDDENLYVAFVCHDDSAAVRATMCQRDLYGSADDDVGFMLDTFGDGTWAYFFFVNPYGVQNDAMWTSVQGEDDGFDMVWTSAGRITADGYTVEMAIPLAGLRFPDANEQPWRINFWRNHPRDVRHQYAWAANDRSEQCFPCQFGTVSGITGLHPGRGFEVLPAFIGYQTGTIRDAQDADSGLTDARSRGELSLGVKYAPSSDLTAEGTVNPDFSQIEADADQIDVNTTIVLRYPEKRPFFQEGNDLFRTMFNSFYTRMVNDPQVAAKGTARWDGTSVAYLMARDEHSPYIIPLEERSRTAAMGYSTVNVLRGLHSLGPNSQIGAMITDRRYDGGGHGTIASVDASLRLGSTLSWATQLVHSATREPRGIVVSPGETFADGKHTVDLDGESYSGPALITDLRLRSPRWNITIDFNEVDPEYRTQTGYDPWNDQRNGFIYLEHVARRDHGLVERVVPGVVVDGRWNYAGQRKWAHANVFADTYLRAAQTHVGVHYQFGEEVWGGVAFRDQLDAGIDIDSRPMRTLGLSASYAVGRGPALLTLDHGDLVSASASLAFKPIDRLILEPSLDYVRSEQAGTGTLLFRQTIVRTRLRLQIDPRLSVRLVAQFNDSRSPYYQDAAVAGDFPEYHIVFGRKWEIDPLITYRLNSFSVFYLGATRDYHDFNAADPGASSLYRLTDRQYFVKLQYLWQS